MSNLQSLSRDFKNGLLTLKQDREAYRQEKMFSLMRFLMKKGRIEKRCGFNLMRDNALVWRMKEI